MKFWNVLFAFMMIAKYNFLSYVNNRNNSFAFWWIALILWIIFIRKKYVKKNMLHSFNFTNRRFFVLICKINLNALWSMIIVNCSSSKYCDNLINVQTKTFVFNFVIQYFVLTFEKFREIYKIDFSTSFNFIWCNAIS